MSWETALAAEGALTALAALFVYLLLRRQRRGFGTLEERATLRTLAFATSTMRSLRRGLTAASTDRVLAEVAGQAGATAIALYDQRGLLGFHPVSAGPGESHRLHAGIEAPAVLEALAAGRLRLVQLHPRNSGSCELRSGVVAPLVVGERPVAALVTYHVQTPRPAALRIASDLAELLATQLRLQEAEQQRVALARSELRALRAQISPHFIYNALNTIAAFIRTDPDRARELVLEFADFTRRAFQDPQAEFTTLADELIYVRQYLKLEQARLGDRLHILLNVEPEVLNASVPTLLIQPLVENAVKHGIETAREGGTITIRAEDQDDECLIVVHDDGAGFEPGQASTSAPVGPRGGLPPSAEGDPDVPTPPVPRGGLPPSAGRQGDPDAPTPPAATRSTGALANVGRRLRQVFGPAHGLVIESRPGSGTTVQVRVPKYRPGVRAS